MPSNPELPQNPELVPSQEPNPWECFEALPGLVAVTDVWKRRMGRHYPVFRAICLEPDNWQVMSYPCPRKCGCWHRVIPRPDHNGAVGTCCCNPPRCADLDLSQADITPLKLNWTKLGRELCRAFGFISKYSKMQVANTVQIGAWSSAGIPAVLTIQVMRSNFRSAVGELTSRLRDPFILFAPSSEQFTAITQELLEKSGAAFFALDSHLKFTDQGTFQPIRPPGELFAKFTPQLERQASYPAICAPKYALRKGLGVWHLTFDGKDAVLRHERGIFYVAWLLHNPPEQPIHAIDLAAKIPEIYRRQLGLSQIADPATGKSTPMQSDARIQERSLALDDVQAMRVLLRKQRELEAILDSEGETEPVKQEALRELESIAEFQRQHGRRTKDTAQSAAKTVRRAIHRFHRHLLRALDTEGKSHPVLLSLSAHLKDHILIPSARYSGNGGPNARTGLAGCFTYEPPPGVTWSG